MTVTTVGCLATSACAPAAGGNASRLAAAVFEDPHSHPRLRHRRYGSQVRRAPVTVSCLDSNGEIKTLEPEPFPR